MNSELKDKLIDFDSRFRKMSLYKLNDSVLYRKVLMTLLNLVKKPVNISGANAKYNDKLIKVLSHIGNLVIVSTTIPGSSVGIMGGSVYFNNLEPESQEKIINYLIENLTIPIVSNRRG